MNIETAGAAIIVAVVLALAIAVIGYDAGHDRGEQTGRADVCAELAAAGFPVGGASSVSTDTPVERTGC